MAVYTILASTVLFLWEILYSCSREGCVEKTNACYDSPQSTIHSHSGSEAAVQSWEHIYVDGGDRNESCPLYFLQEYPDSK